ncbi:MAG: hypothetical protein GX589_08810 [Deltaproteobacteria bacterium]|nr:hypothetical protein [Deltaproteobacteria bacterium]
MADNQTHSTATVALAQTGRAHFEMRPSGVAIVYLGTQQEKIVTLSMERMDSLNEILSQLETRPPAGLVFMASAPDMFSVGADIRAMQKLKTASEAEQCTRTIQALFNRIAALPFCTVAAISGPCLGGACELALCCRFRIISDLPASQIGLPEIKIGIIPALGGTQRLVRLVGIQAALEMILRSKMLGPVQAKALGLVDDVLPYDMLLLQAEKIALRSGATSKRRMGMVTYLPPLRRLVINHAKRQLSAKVGDFYPAPQAALECMALGLERGLEAGLDLEARNLGKLLVSPVARNLMRLFFIANASKALGKSALPKLERVQVLVAGAGKVGATIATTLAKAGCGVTLKDQSEQALRQALGRIRTNVSALPYLSSAERSFILNRIETTTRESVGLSQSAFLIDALPEELELKQRVLDELSKMLYAEALVAVTGPSFTVAKVAAGLEHPDRVVGMSFFTPLKRGEAVEIVRASKTSDRTLILAAALAVKAGCYPIIVNDAPGFLLMRCLAPYLLEGLALLKQGYAPLEIDSCARAFGMDSGPFEIMDRIGLELTSKIFSALTAAYGERMRPCLELSRLMDQDCLGKSTRQGFYEYRGERPRLNSRVQKILGLPGTAALTPLPQDSDLRLLLPIIGEALRCLDEGIAGRPGNEAAEQIDLGSIIGIGFPAFRGGVLWYAQGMGLKNLLREFDKREKSLGKRFSAPDGLTRRINGKQSFYS